QILASALVSKRKKAQEDDRQDVALVICGLDRAAQGHRGLPELADQATLSAIVRRSGACFPRRLLGRLAIGLDRIPRPSAGRLLKTGSTEGEADLVALVVGDRGQRRPH